MVQEITPLRVVLDTNTLISALLFGGDSWRRLRNSWQTGRIIPLVCRKTTLEFIRVLKYPKFTLTLEEREILMADFLPFTEVITVSEENSTMPRCRDMDDQIFLELAQQGNASFLVSGDKDLLDCASRTGFKIITPSEFTALIE